MTVSELSQTMTAAEEAHWIALCGEEPMWPRRMENGLARIAQLIHNSNVKKQDALGLTDFMPWFRKKVVASDEKVVDSGVREFFGRFKKGE